MHSRLQRTLRLLVEWPVCRAPVSTTGVTLMRNLLPIGHQHLNEVATRSKMKLFVAVVKAISNRFSIRAKRSEPSENIRLLIFMLKARRPARFRDNYVSPPNSGADNTIVIRGGLPVE
jgi:hypothetical protein